MPSLSAGGHSNLTDYLSSSNLIPHVIQYMFRYSTEMYDQYSLNARYGVPGFKGRIRDIAVRILMRDIFHRACVTPTFSTTGIKWMTSPMNTTESSLLNYVVNPFFNTYYNNSGVSGLSNGDYVEARSGAVWLTSVIKMMQPLKTYPGLNDYGNLSNYLSGIGNGGNSAMILPHNPATIDSHMKVIVLVDSKYARKMRTNVLLERNLFEIPHSAVRVWYDLSRSGTKAEDNLNDGIKSLIINRIKQNEEGLIIEEKKNILDLLTNKVTEVIPGDELVIAAANFFKAKNLSAMKFAV